MKVMLPPTAIRHSMSSMFRAALAIVLGSEDRGVRELVKHNSDFVVSIPMRGQVGSLNVSVAAAVTLFEIARRRPAASASAETS